MKFFIALACTLAASTYADVSHLSNMYLPPKHGDSRAVHTEHHGAHASASAPAPSATKPESASLAGTHQAAATKQVSLSTALLPANFGFPVPADLDSNSISAPIASAASFLSPTHSAEATFSAPSISSFIYSAPAEAAKFEAAAPAATTFYQAAPSQLDAYSAEVGSLTRAANGFSAPSYSVSQLSAPVAADNFHAAVQASGSSSSPTSFSAPSASATQQSSSFEPVEAAADSSLAVDNFSGTRSLPSHAQPRHPSTLHDSADFTARESRVSAQIPAASSIETKYGTNGGYVY